MSISIEQVNKRFGNFVALDNVNLAIKTGELTALLGPSGSGKTTLLRIIAGLEQADSGIIRFNSEDITGQHVSERGVGFVFQHYALFKHMTVFENVAFGLRMQKVRGSEAEQRVKEVLELVELNDFAGRYPQQLSGGQCQRVALARSLVTRPRLLLLDEPLSALDARIRKHLREQIRSIQQELGLTTIFVTHDQEEALVMSDRIFLMNAGKIVQSGDAETLYTAPADAFAAGFIGNYNLLDADTASRLLLRPVNSRVAIRPEAIQIGAQGSIEGQIRSHRLLGNVIRYRIEARGVELLVDVLNRSPADLHASGQRINLNIEDNAICEVA